MTQVVAAGDGRADERGEKIARLTVHFFQFLFLAVLLLQLDDPFLSAHNERQNETFDMARHVYRDGWRAVLTPKASYSWRGTETQPFTPMLYELPFHGLIAWPLALVTTHERAVMRLISGAFGLAAIQLIYLILRFWLPPGSAAAGAGVFALAPLFLHFGQVPMPDVLSTAGMLAAFWFALRGELAASSAGFLFTVLAKLSSVVFGLPVLVALALARHCGSKKDFIRVAILWGWLPLSGLLLWEYLLHHYSPPTEMTVGQILTNRSSWDNLIKSSFYKIVIGSLVPMGIRVMGSLGLICSVMERQKLMNGWVKGAIIFSNAFYFLFVVRNVSEPQYLLPMLAWCVIGAAFGFHFLLTKRRLGRGRQVALGAAVVLHLLVAGFFTVDLKSSRVPNYPSILRAAELLPPDARVLVLCRYYGASPAVWLNRNVLPVGDKFPAGFPGACDLAYRSGFRYLLILDIESWHNQKTGGGPLAMMSRVIKSLRKTPPAASPESDDSLIGLTSPTSPYRQYCDLVFTPMMVAPRTVLYSMASLPEKRELGEKIIWPQQ